MKHPHIAGLLVAGILLSGIAIQLIWSNNALSQAGANLFTPAALKAQPWTLEDLRSASGVGASADSAPLSIDPVQPGLDWRPIVAQPNPVRAAGYKGRRVEREKWYAHMRVYPGTGIPLQARQQAFELLQRQARVLGPAAMSAWQNIGPAPIADTNLGSFQIDASGRTTAVLVHPHNPSVLYAAGAQGGVWKTTDGGQTWTALTDNQPTLAVGTMAFDPANPNIIYVGTGEPHGSADSYYGAGLLKSTDGGATWTQLGAAKFAGMGIANIVVHPTNANLLYVAASISVIGRKPVADVPGIYKSTDGGANWTRIAWACQDTNVPSTCVSPSALVMDPANSNVLYAAFDQLGIFKSTNGGVNWTEKLGPNTGLSGSFRRAEVAVSPSNGAVLYAGLELVVQNGTHGALFRSTNGGDNWTYLNSLQASYCGSQCSYDNIIAVHPTNPNFVLAGGAALYSQNVAGIDGVVFKTTDGGASWTHNAGLTAGSTIHPDLHAIAFDPSNPNTIWLGTDGGVFRSTDAGGTWQHMNANLGTLQFQSVALHPTDVNTVFGGMQDNAKAKTTNGGTTWVGLDVGDGGITAIDPFNPTQWYGTRFSLSGQFMQFQRNDSNGSAAVGDWLAKSSGIDVNDRVMFYAPLAVDPNTPGRVYWGTHRLYRSNDRGNSWTAISPDLTKNQGAFSAISNFAIAPGNSNIILVGTADGHVQLTVDGGANWTNATKAPLPNRFVSDVAIQSVQVMYAVYNGFNANTPSTPGHVFKTTDGGQTWTNVSRTGQVDGLPDLPVLTIALDPDTGDVYVGTDLGVYRSLDGGATWAPFNQSLPLVAVYDLALAKYAGGVKVLVAATHGRSIWRVQLSGGPTMAYAVYLPAVARGTGGGVAPTATPAATATNTPPAATATNTPPAATATTAPGQIVNGNFEQGRGVGWQEYNSRGLAMVRLGSSLNPPVTPYSGQWLASLFALERSEVSQIGQNVALPAGTPLYLNLYYIVVSDESCSVGMYDSFTIYINSAQFYNLNICRSNSTTDWAPAYWDISAYAGQTVSIIIEASTLSDGGQTRIYLDDISIGATHP